MKYIGKKIYFDKATGDIILIIGERFGDVIETTLEQDINTYKALSERNPETFDYMQLEYGQYAQDFIECNYVRVNIEKLNELPRERWYEALEFSYPDENEDKEGAIIYRKPLSEEIKEQKKAIAELTILLSTIMGGVNE